MKKLLIAVVLLVGCASPEEVIILPDPMGGGMLGGGDLMPRVEYRCPKCAKQYKTEYLAQQCIDKHD